jgi:ribosome-binding protein aMBF1 (putative translation factor)
MGRTTYSWAGEVKVMAEYSEVVAARRARMSTDSREQAKVFNRGAALAADVLGLRLARGWTQTELAERSGIDQADISRIERGLSNATEGTLGRLAEVLDAEIHMTPREPLSV